MTTGGTQSLRRRRGGRQGISSNKKDDDAQPQQQQFSDHDNHKVDDVDNSTTVSNDGPVIISYSSLVLATLPLILLSVLCIYLELLDISQSLLVGAIRAGVQLSLLGTLLHPIFAWGDQYSAIVIAYAFVMVVLAAQEVSSRTLYDFEGQWQAIFGSLLLTISIVAAFTFQFVLHLKPWHTPRYVIPITGMLLGNSINGITLSLNAIAKAFVEDSAELELLLAFGATPYEALHRLVAAAITAGATPMLTMLRVTGIISIPGMMTGQLLGGTTTVQAARYQLLILYLIAVCTLGVILLQTLYCALYVGMNHDTYMLVAERFQPKPTTANSNSKVMALWGLITSLLALFGWSHTTDATIFSSMGPPSAINITRGTIEIQSIKGPQSTTTTPLLELQGIRRSIQQRVLFENITMEVHAGDLIFVKGSSGTGKSQLMRIVAGLTPVDDNDDAASVLALEGTTWDQHHLSSSSSSSLGHTPAHWRRQIRQVPQTKVQIPGTPRDFVHRVASFRSWKEERKACRMNNGIENNNYLCPPTDEHMIRAIVQYLEEWKLHPANDFMDKEWSQLSGGEGQRIILAIALASRPRVLLVDESTSALDNDAKQAVEQTMIQEVLRSRRRKQQDGSMPDMAILWVSHDNQQVERLLDALQQPH